MAHRTYNTDSCQEDDKRREPDDGSDNRAARHGDAPVPAAPCDAAMPVHAG
jgi:hypothetical protein